MTFTKKSSVHFTCSKQNTPFWNNFPQKKHLGHGCLISKRNQTETFQTSSYTSIFTLPFRIDSLNFLLKILSLNLTAKAPENRQCMHVQGGFAVSCGGGVRQTTRNGTKQNEKLENMWRSFIQPLKVRHLQNSFIINLSDFLKLYNQA